MVDAKSSLLNDVKMIIPGSWVVEELASVGTECGKRSQGQYQVGSHFFSPAVDNASDQR
jgi:hypothetical protein